MNKDDIIALARAGFSAAQIAALAAAPAAAAPAAAAPAAAAPAAAAPAAAAPAAAAPVSSDPVAQMLAKVGALTDAIQASAILGSNQPKQETADDILAAIIAPPMLGDNNTK